MGRMHRRLRKVVTKSVTEQSPCRMSDSIVRGTAEVSFMIGGRQVWYQETET
jgi:hypothetical protein